MCLTKSRDKNYPSEIMCFLILLFFIAVLLSGCQEAPTAALVNSADNTGISMDNSFPALHSGTIVAQTIDGSDLMQPGSGWSELRNQVYDFAGDKKVTIKLYGSSADGNKGIKAVLEYGKESLMLGAVCNYGIDETLINMFDLTNDGENELVIQGSMGAALTSSIILGYDAQKDLWKQLLTVDNADWRDLDKNGSLEIISQSKGSLPPFVSIYSWKGDHFDMTDAAEATGNDYAILRDLDNGGCAIEAGQIEEGMKRAANLYAYRDGKLIQHSKAFKEWSEYILPESSRRLLVEKDLEGLSGFSLELARNEIYAKHGYFFTNDEYKSYFGNKSWYSVNKEYNESLLSDIERKNAALLKHQAEKYSANFKKIEGNTFSADLNGDGSEEDIRLECEPGANSYTLRINDASFTGEGDNLDGFMFLSDIDNEDRHREIAVTESGPSSDEATYFFYYDNNEIHFMGKISGSQYVMQIAGDGKVFTRTRGAILQTWFYPDYYRLTASHELENIPQLYYRMNTVATVQKQLKLQKSPSNEMTSVILEPGEDVMITRSDNREWCEVENSSGKTGWFAVDSFDTIRGTGLSASEFFDGLCYAD